MWHLITHKTEIVYSPLHINKMQRISLVIAVAAISGFTAEAIELDAASKATLSTEVQRGECHNEGAT